MQIFIDSSTTSHYLIIECEPSDLVSDLKAYIEAKEAISVSMQSLTFQCKPLKDNISLKDYGIKDNSMVSLSLRLKAGSNKITPMYNSFRSGVSFQEITAQKKQTEVEIFFKDKRRFLPDNFQSIGEVQKWYEENTKSGHKWEDLNDRRTPALALSDDNRYVITGMETGAIFIDDLQEHKTEKLQEAHQDTVSSVAISKDSQFIISGSIDQSIKVFDLNTKEELIHFEDAHEGPVRAVALTNDNQYVISASNRSIKMFDIQNKQEHHHFIDVHEGMITSIAVSRDNEFIISGSNDKSIKIINMRTRQEYHHFKDAHERAITSLVMSKDGRFIVSGSYDRSIKIFEFHTKKEYHHFKDIYENGVSSLDVFNDNKFIISVSFGQLIKVFDIQTKQEYFQFELVVKNKDNPVSSPKYNGSVAISVKNKFISGASTLRISNDNKFIVLGSEAANLKIYYLRKQEEELYHFKDIHKSDITSVAVSKNQQFIVLGSTDKSIKIFDFKTKTELHHFQDIHEGAVTVVAVSDSNKFIVSGSEDGSVKIIDTEAKKELHHFKNAHERPVTSVIVFNNDELIVSGSYDRSIKVFDVKKKELRYHFDNLHRRGVLSISVSKDNQFIVSGSDDKSIGVLELKTIKQYHFKDIHKNSVLSVYISSDNRYIVSGSKDKSIKVFDFQKVAMLNKESKPSQLLLVFEPQNLEDIYHFENAHEGAVTSITLSDDNKFIISGSDDGSIKIFDLEAKQEHYHFRQAHKKGVISVILSETDNLPVIISGSADKSLKLFQIPQTSSPVVSHVSQNIPHYVPVKFNAFFFKSINPGSVKELFQFYKDLNVSPVYWTILHLVSIFQSTTTIAELPSYADFKAPFLLDRFGKSPLHYLLSQESIHFRSADIVMDYILDYIEDQNNRTPYELEMIFKSLTPLLPFILWKTNPKIRDRYLQIAFMPSPCLGELPLFGLPESKHVFTNTSIINETIKQKIFKEGNEQIMFRNMMLYYDYNPALHDMHDLVWILLYLKNEDIFKSPLIGHLIDHLWKRTQSIMFLSAAPYTAYMILLSVYFGTGDRLPALEVIIIIFAFILLSAEFIQMWSLRKRYLQMIWNLLDVGQIVLAIVYFLMRLKQDEDIEMDTLNSQWISSVILLAGYVRWVSYLRLFKPTRNLIQVIISIMKDMLGFVIVLTFIIVGFSLIFFQFNRDNEYPIHLNTTYLVLYGSYDGGDMNVSQKLLAALILFLLNVVLLNLLISIMGDSYDKLQERALLVGSVTRLEMILEAMAYMRVFRLKKNGEKGFLIYCLPEGEEDENSQNSEWEGRINMIRKLLKQNEQKIEEANQGLEKNMSSFKKEVEKKIEGIETEISQVKQLVENNHKEILDAIKVLGGNR